MNFLGTLFLGNPIRTWLIALGVAAATLVVLLLLRGVVVRRLVALAKRTETSLDDLVVALLSSTKLFFVILVALFAGSLVLAIPERANVVIRVAVVVAVILQAALWANKVIGHVVERYSKRKEIDGATLTTVRGLAFIGRVVLWAFVFLLVLANLGIDITALVAGLGVGGIAVALAVQNILGDLFASLSIMLDKPFVIGDFIIVDDFLGSVEHVGLKTTRLRSLGGEQIVFSNADLLKSRIKNYKRMFERRCVFALGVTYDTPQAKLAVIPAIIKEAVQAQAKTRFDRAHFKEFGAYSLNYEVVYYVLDPDYNLYMDIQQAINLAIFRRFAEEGIQFAFPTQSLYVVDRAVAPAAAGSKSPN